MDNYKKLKPCYRWKVTCQCFHYGIKSTESYTLTFEVLASDRDSAHEEASKKKSLYLSPYWHYLGLTLTKLDAPIFEEVSK